jgi:hypothetical protein
VRYALARARICVTPAGNVGRAGQRAGHGISELAEREDCDAATKGIEPPDVLVEARDRDPKARRERRERQLVQADLVGKVGAPRHHDR